MESGEQLEHCEGDLDYLDKYDSILADKWEADTRSDEELFRIVLNKTCDYGEQGTAVYILRYRATREIFDTAIALCRAKMANERKCGVNILAMFGNQGRGQDPQYHSKIASLMLDMLKHEKRVTVLRTLIWAHSYLDDDRAVELLSSLTNHTSWRLRLELAITLGHFSHRNERALKELIKLSSDPVRDVRDWASFELGTQFDPGDLDSQEAHQALWRLAEEDDTEIRHQALCGLVLRGEKGLNDRLIHELTICDEIYDDIIEAIEYIADPVFLPYLLPLREWDELPGRLEDAITACGGKAGIECTADPSLHSG